MGITFNCETGKGLDEKKFVLETVNKNKFI